MMNLIGEENTFPGMVFVGLNPRIARKMQRTISKILLNGDAFQEKLLLVLVGYRDSTRHSEIRVHREFRRVINFLGFNVCFLGPILQHCCFASLWSHGFFNKQTKKKPRIR